MCFIVAVYIRDCHPARERLKVASSEVQKVTHANVHSLPGCQPSCRPPVTSPPPPPASTTLSSAPVSRHSSQGCIRGHLNISFPINYALWLSMSLEEIKWNVTKDEKKRGARVYHEGRHSEAAHVGRHSLKIQPVPVKLKLKCLHLLFSLPFEI